MIRSIAHRTRAKRVFYAKDVDMRMSFDGLADVAKKMLGAELEVGDIIICDNERGDKRKVMQWTQKGFIIFYARYHKELFEKIQDFNGQVKRFAKTEIIE